MRQLTIYDQIGQLPSNGVATSDDAADSMAHLAATQRDRVLAFLVERGEAGATDEEMQDVLDMNPSSQRPRRGELVAAGLVHHRDDRRATRSGRTAYVWYASRTPLCTG